MAKTKLVGLSLKVINKTFDDHIKELDEDILKYTHEIGILQEKKDSLIETIEFLDTEITETLKYRDFLAERKFSAEVLRRRLLRND